MTIQAASGTITQPTSGGNQSYSGLGFQPVALLFFGNRQTADGSSANAVFMVGAATSSSSCNAAAAVHTNASANNQVGMSDANCIEIWTTGGSPEVTAVLVSMDADGFTLNWTTVDATQRRFHYLALAGISNAKTGKFDNKTNPAGTRAYTGLGFQPDCVLFYGGWFNDTTAIPGATTNARFTLGWMTGTSSAQSTQMFVGTANSDTQHVQKTTSCVMVIGSALNTIVEASLQSFDSDGFTLNWTTTIAGVRWGLYLALKGATLGQGSFTQPGSTGNQSVTVTGVAPAAVILSSANATASSSILAQTSQSIGVGISSSNRRSIWFGDLDAQATAANDTNSDATKVLNLMTATGTGSPTLNAAADFVSQDNGGFTVNWTTADATAREILYLAIGNAAAAGGGVTQMKRNFPLDGLGMYFRSDGA